MVIKEEFTANPADAPETCKQAQHRLLSMLQYEGRRAYRDKQINELIRISFYNGGVSAVIAHYEKWIVFGLRPENLLYFVKKYKKKGIKILNNPILVENKLFSLMAIQSHVQLKSILDTLSLAPLSLLEFLLEDNGLEIFQTLRTLTLWTGALSREPGHAVRGSRAFMKIPLFFGVTSDTLITALSNVGIAKSINVVDKLTCWIEKRSSETSVSISIHSVLSILDLNVTRFIEILTKFDSLENFQLLKDVVSWAVSLAVRSDNHITSKAALAHTLSILDITTEQLVKMVLANNAGENFEKLKELNLWVLRLSPKPPQVPKSRQEILAEMLVILGLDTEQFIKLLVDIHRYKSFDIIEDLIEWVKQMSVDSNFTHLSVGSNSSMSPKDILAGVLNTSALDLEQLIIKLMYFNRRAKKIESFKDAIQWAIELDMKRCELDAWEARMNTQNFFLSNDCDDEEIDVSIEKNLLSQFGIDTNPLSQSEPNIKEEPLREYSAQQDVLCNKSSYSQYVSSGRSIFLAADEKKENIKTPLVDNNLCSVDDDSWMDVFLSCI